MAIVGLEGQYRVLKLNIAKLVQRLRYFKVN